MASAVSSTGLIVRPAPLIHIPNADTGGLSLAELVEEFLRSKRLQEQAGEVCGYVLTRYEKVCQRLVAWFGERRKVLSIRGIDFRDFRESLPNTWGVATVGRFIQCTRSIFRFAYEMELIDRPVRFGPNFKTPPLRLFRRQKRLRGSMMLEAAEIRTLLEKCEQPMQSMILLAVNCGYGVVDVGLLEFSFLDLKNGWVNFPRPKTEADRRCPLWPETIQSIQWWLGIRPEPKRRELENLIFLSRRGTCFFKPMPPSNLVQRTRRLFQRTGIYRDGLGFYSMRRSFETIGGELADQAAVDLIMGHCPRPNDMAAVYRQRIDDKRLIAVVNYVRAWLFPASDFVATATDTNKKITPRVYEKSADVPLTDEAAAAIRQWPFTTAELSVLADSLTALGIPQRQLAQWWLPKFKFYQDLLYGRKHIPAVRANELRVLFGLEPMPLPKKRSYLFRRGEVKGTPVPKCGEMPAPAEIESLFDGRQFGTAELRIVVDFLRKKYRVTMRQISVWIGEKPAYLSLVFFKNPQQPACVSRLRSLFAFAQEGGAAR